jgi:riboflavin kinase/FMN adenylyltransferase
VIHGDKRGREIGFPTANMLLGHYLRPAYGIYAVRAQLPDGRVLPGAASLGIRPTFDPPRELLETFIFDFAESLYGQTIEVALIERLRGEEKFASIEALVAQMAQDVTRARAILGA